MFSAIFSVFLYTDTKTEWLFKPGKWYSKIPWSSGFPLPILIHLIFINQESSTRNWRKSPNLIVSCRSLMGPCATAILHSVRISCKQFIDRQNNEGDDELFSCVPSEEKLQCKSYLGQTKLMIIPGVSVTLAKRSCQWCNVQLFWKRHHEAPFL